jgi:hypothetical protein
VKIIENIGVGELKKWVFILSVVASAESDD